MTPITTSIPLGFYDQIGTPNIYAKQNDSMRKITFELIDEMVGYAVEDTTHIFLCETFSNGIILTPQSLKDQAEFSDDHTEMTITLSSDMLSVPGIAHCEIVFCKADHEPQIIDGHIDPTGIDILSTQNFNIYIDSDVYTDGCMSAADQIAVSELIPLIIKLEALIAKDIEFEHHEETRMENELQRQSNEADRIAAEEARENAEASREAAEEAREETHEEMIDLMEHPPIVGENGNWWIYDAELKQYTDTGIDATATVNVKKITMIDPGATPYVENTGTATDPVLEFFIPYGVGILSVQKESSSGDVDTYKMTYSDGRTYTYQITNGKSAYSSAVDGGYSGTEQQFNSDLAEFKDLAEQSKQAAQAAHDFADLAATYSTFVAPHLRIDPETMELIVDDPGDSSITLWMEDGTLYCNVAYPPTGSGQWINV